MKLNLACLLLLFAVSAAFSQEAQKTAPLAPPIPVLTAPPIPALVAPPAPAPAAPPVPAPAPAPAAPPAPVELSKEAPPKLAIYVYGTSDTSINKSMGNKLLAAMTQSGEYAGIANPGSFQDEIDKSGKSDTAQISNAAKRHNADYVCVVSMAEVFGIYSITARLLKIANLQVVKVGSTDHLLKSPDDQTTVSNELARLLLPPSASPAAPTTVPSVAPPAAAVAVQNQCAKTYNINEILFKINKEIPSKLKDCSSTLAKDIATPAMLGGKKLDTKLFMTQCAVDGIKKELPDGFPGTAQVIGSLTNFTQGISNSAIADGAIDPKKLLNAVAYMHRR
ncbi:hypothetical protein R83H12_01483 [Fibrobacteria bacterium R8-3-H12]